MAITLTRAIPGKTLGRLPNIAKKLKSGAGGITMGELLEVIREVNVSKKFRDLPEGTPFYEITKILSDDLDGILIKLSKLRNDQAHGRGPKGSKILSQLEKAKNGLEKFLQAIEFLASYSLIHIISTHRDSIAGITK